MDNNQIADALSLLAKLTDIHGDNGFKSKSYSAAAFTVEKLGFPLSEKDKAQIAFIKGIGPSSAKKIIEMIETGHISALDKLLADTPPGILEMLHIKGIGPKKIHTIWKEMEIETIGELQYACNENRLKLYKGFGEKTQQNIADAIEFYQLQKGKLLFADAILLAEVLENMIHEKLPDHKFEKAGALQRQLEMVEEICFTTDINIEHLLPMMSELKVEQIQMDGNQVSGLYMQAIHIRVVCFEQATYYRASVLFNSSDMFREKILPIIDERILYESEEDVFEKNQLPYIPAFLREDHVQIDAQLHEISPNIIQHRDIKGIIHCHSNWSDGSNTIQELAQACISKNLEYLVISDHSQSAFYANGLNPERIKAQHELIEELNSYFAPFKIFKSIECDILSDGKLDYSDEVLASFDLVIASVHSQLKMNEEKAMSRLLRAISNPFTTILGHPSGRLLLSRPAYPLNYEILMEACKIHGVAIELNANPNRLDLDWRYLDECRQKGIMISINPDAHQIAGLDDTQYGVYAAQKGRVTPKMNLSSMSLLEFEDYLVKRKAKNQIT